MFCPGDRTDPLHSWARGSGSGGGSWQVNAAHPGHQVTYVAKLLKMTFGVTVLFIMYDMNASLSGLQWKSFF
jgi:hypothetical protein